MRVFVVCLALLTSLPAGAYELYKSPDNPDASLHWRTDTVMLVFDDLAPEELVSEVAAEECEDSFAVWSQLTCGEVFSPFTFNFEGFIHGRQVGYNEDPSATNENLVIWIQDGAKWHHGPGVLALTSLTYDTNTGQIVDGDLEMNDAEFFLLTVSQ
ncbi:MAG TPA: hypothetical protein EYN06_01020 [Myxococcales bacterium]|nr:hypothetical protein [Myxococcales bacterium]